MSADSFICALSLFAACIGGWHLAARLRGAGRLYVRFAAVLLAALVVCKGLGLGDAAALFLLPLAGAALVVAAWARFGGVHVPDLVAALTLVLALGLGLGGALTGNIILSLLPVVAAALVAGAFALAARALVAVLGACALGLIAPAFAGQGAGGGVLLLAAAALVGLARARDSISSASIPSVQQPQMRAAGAAIGAGRRRKMAD